MAATRLGVVKKTPLVEYDTSRRDGIIAINLEDNDELIGVQLTDGKQDIILVTAGGQAIRFTEEEARPMARATKGVRGIKLMDDDYVVGMEVAREDSQLLVITANGYGKRTPLDEYRQQSRGGKGVFTVRPSERNGEVAGVLVVRDGEEIMAISKEGIIIRIKVDEISSMGRTTQGVTLMRVSEEEQSCFYGSCSRPRKPGRKIIINSNIHQAAQRMRPLFLRICPLQCRQRQQNISLTRAHKVILLYDYANIPINIVLTHKNERNKNLSSVSPQKKPKCNKSVTTACYNSTRGKENHSVSFHFN